MSVYTVPSLSAVDFALTVHTVPSLASPAEALAVYTVPSLSAVDFALTAYTVPTYMDIGWELLPSVSGITQYLGLRSYYHGAVQDLALIAAADAITGMGGAPMVRKNGVTYAVYLVETTDPDASPIRVRTTTGIKAIRQKT
ncbi:MAG: hypothetical protein IPL76_10655 [Gemmatimonadetes bacterium]|jgi:hypothetical protein|nr:hypothetical protein [Gemmatimonadota bacterium]